MVWGALRIVPVRLGTATTSLESAVVLLATLAQTVTIVCAIPNTTLMF